MKKPTIVSMQAYDTKISAEIGYSDTNLDQVMNLVKCCLLGLGYYSESFDDWCKEYAESLNEEKNA